MRQFYLLTRTATLISVLCLPGVAFAQTGDISGQVTDNTGGVLPGVTVEASSPALIEGSRVSVTDGQGRYSLTLLRTGTYSVAVSLPGFSTVVREGVEVVTNFTATVDAELSVGSIEETITVSGEAPLVDVQRTVQSEVISRDVVDSLPTGRNPWGVGMTLPGMTTRSAAGLAVGEVGGIGGAQQNYLMRHGSDQGDSHTEIDGMNVSSGFGGGEHNALYHDDGQVQEYTYDSIGGTSEHQTSGVIINLVPKEGGNTVTGSAYASFANEGMYTSNYSPAQAAQGLKAPSQVKKLWDYNFSLGGPLVADRLWFFASTRFWGNDKTSPVTFDQPGVDAGENYSFENNLKSGLLRLTAQANTSNKVNVSYNVLHRYRPFINTSAGPNPSVAYTREGTMRSPTLTPYVGQVKWTSTLNNRMLLETGYSINHMSFGTYYQDFIAPGAITREDTSLRQQWSAGDTNTLRVTEMNYASSKLSIVTGSHSAKIGFSYSWGYDTSQVRVNGDLHQQYSNGVPTSVQVYSTPTLRARNEVAQQIGFFAQDSWTIDRLTVNGGVRFDYFKGNVPAQEAGAGRFVPARSVAAFDAFPTFSDISPRIGLAYDISGDGRTALKFAVGRYVEQEATGYPGGFNVLRTSNETRPWSDTNGDDIAQDSEIGAARNAKFGLPGSRAVADPSLSRNNNYSVNANLEHELRPGLSISGGYYYRKYSNFRETHNSLTSASDYDSAQYADPRGNGRSVTVSWLNAAMIGKVDNFIRNTENWRNYNGFDINLNARFGDGGVLSTGFSAGRIVKNDCDYEDPNGRTHGGRPFFAKGGPFCDQTQFDIPFDKTFKMHGAYPLPLPSNIPTIAISGVFQSVPGDVRTISKVVTRRNFPQATFGYTIIPLSQPGEDYLPRHNQLDLKLNTTIEAGNARIRPELAIYNLINVDTILVQNNFHGGSLDNIAAIIDGRVIRLGVNITF